MNAKYVWSSALLLLPLGAVVSFSQGQDKQATPASAPTDDPMKLKMKEYATPGPSHKVLDAKVGKWTATMKCFADPKAAPMESKGTSDIKWIMDGRFLQESFTGDYMGAPFQGQGTYGFDNIKKKYIASWYGNMGTGICLHEGTYDAAKKVFTFTGEAPDVMTGKFVQERWVDTMKDADHWTMQAYRPGPDGKEFMAMEVQYTRSK